MRRSGSRLAQHRDGTVQADDIDDDDIYAALTKEHIGQPTKVSSGIEYLADDPEITAQLSTARLDVSFDLSRAVAHAARAVDALDTVEETEWRRGRTPGTAAGGSHVYRNAA